MSHIDYPEKKKNTLNHRQYCVRGIVSKLARNLYTYIICQVRYQKHVLT